jgi:hypothetical protein
VIGSDKQELNVMKTRTEKIAVKKTKKKKIKQVSRRNKVLAESKVEIAPARAPGVPLKTIHIGSVTLNGFEQIRAEFCQYPHVWVLKLCRGVISKRGEFTHTQKQFSFSVRNMPEFVTLVRKAHKQAKRDGLLPKIKGEQADE